MGPNPHRPVWARLGVALVHCILMAGAVLMVLALRTRHDKLAFVASGAAVKGVVATAGLSMFPFILPSSLDPSMSLTVWDASSSRATLALMLVAVVLILPAVLAYTAFVYRVLRGRVTPGRGSAFVFARLPCARSSAARSTPRPPAAGR